MQQTGAGRSIRSLQSAARFATRDTRRLVSHGVLARGAKCSISRREYRYSRYRRMSLLPCTSWRTCDPDEIRWRWLTCRRPRCCDAEGAAARASDGVLREREGGNVFRWNLRACSASLRRNVSTAVGHPPLTFSLTSIARIRVERSDTLIRNNSLIINPPNLRERVFRACAHLLQNELTSRIEAELIYRSVRRTCPSKPD